MKDTRPSALTQKVDIASLSLSGIKKSILKYNEALEDGENPVTPNTLINGAKALMSCYLNILETLPPEYRKETVINATDSQGIEDISTLIDQQIAK